MLLPTDSVIGTVVQHYAGGFLLRTDEGKEYAFEIVPDTVDRRQEIHPDSVDRRVPHASVMSERDMWFVLRQLEESDERDRIHVHYVTVGETDPRRIAIWVSIELDRVPPG